MQKTISLRVQAAEAEDDTLLKKLIATAVPCPTEDITGYILLKKSLDARGRTIWVNLTVAVYVGEPFPGRESPDFHFKAVGRAQKSVIIVGAGPAGLFAALRCLELGIKPILIERGKDVRSRRRDLAMLNKTGEVNPDSNYCFGEGGAGTYSDGKLYTRSNKRGDINRILNLFVQFGAEESILYDAHPHIGTNKLPAIIVAMRNHIVDCGGEIHFEKRLVDLELSGGRVKSIKTADGAVFSADAVLLATGHSARDIFELLHHKSVLIEAKPFALGVRVEHQQALIDNCQYAAGRSHNDPLRQERPAYLPAAAYSLVQQVDGRGVFSFCMCPGGIIAPAATSPGQLVVNGWSPSKRNNPFANSGIVVECKPEDSIPWLMQYAATASNPLLDEALAQTQRSGAVHPLLMLYFQQAVERNAFEAGGGRFVAPAQRMADFCSNKVSADLPKCSYIPGVSSAPLQDVLPRFVHQTLQGGFKAFGQKMKGYFTNEAIVVATESRTSSPVRIPRQPDTLQHPQISNLYPCGEGAGYAGGIVSAAMDGERVVNAIAASLGILPA